MPSPLDFLLGEDPSKVQLDDPGLKKAREMREFVAALMKARLEDGEPSKAQDAIGEAAQSGISKFAGEARSGASGARGLGRVLAQTQAQQQIGQGTQQILAQAQQAKAQQAAADEQAAMNSLLGISSMEQQQALTERELREKKAKPGALGFLGSLAGLGIGSALGAPTQGAQLGGALGGGIQQLARPR